MPNLDHKTVGSVLGEHPDPRRAPKATLPLALEGARIGLEIELENIRHLGMPLEDGVPVGAGWWIFKRDGSLRNWGGEFVFSAPLAGDEIIHALDDLVLILAGSRPIASDRCSGHLHLDVRDLTQEQLFMLLLLSIIFEKPMYKMGGDRRNSNYCVPFFKSSSLLRDMQMLRGFRSGDDFATYFGQEHHEGYKYTGMNVRPVGYQGSVEYRMLEGTYDPNRVLDWVNIILSLKRSAIGLGIQADVSLQTISRLPLEELVQLVFGEFAHTIRPFITESDLTHGMRLALDVINHDEIKEASASIHNRFYFNEEGDLFRAYSILHGYDEPEKAKKKKKELGELIAEELVPIEFEFVTIDE